jgi:EF-P beta-lysylation protein EpmB
MIPQSNPQLEWRQELSQAIRSPRQLLEVLQLDMALLPSAETAAKNFGLVVPMPFLNRIEKGNAQDPLLLQVLPLGEELNTHPDFVEDPLRERQANPIPGLLHKFKNRVLLTLATVCAVNCRYCFRRNFDYAQNNPGTEGWSAAFDYIRQHSEIEEVILSGGEPLLLSDSRLQWFIHQLNTIPHLRWLRIHTRLPIVIPSRITPELVKILTQSRVPISVVLHCNHPNELDAEVGQAIARLTKEQIMVFNQVVLLRGVNDQVDTLCELSKRLFDFRILPYYLHVLDKVKGAHHFAISDEEAIMLHKQLNSRLPGYLVPKLVREVAGSESKQVLA